MRTIVWFRKDLRVADHAPLRDAARDGETIPLFLLEPKYFRAGAAPNRTRFVAESLDDLDRSLRSRGSALVCVDGPAPQALPLLAKRWSADRIVAHRRTEPAGRAIDEQLAGSLDVPLDLYDGETLAPPASVRTGDGKPYAVYSPFAKAFFSSVEVGSPLRAPARMSPLPRDVEASAPPGDVTGDSDDAIDGGERNARARLRTFVRSKSRRYDAMRDRMDADATSRLSADLKAGTLSVRDAWHAAQRIDDAASRTTFRKQLLWREFSYAMMWDRPELAREPFRSQWREFPWRDDDDGWTAWVEGTTGYPIVDAAMRQLREEGYVHNRARMIAASFLTKHLLIDYRYGEAHYLRWLIDGDQAVNNLNWQWSAGCGVDAQPYFRVFNPVTQGRKLDPDGDYVRRYVPELSAVPTRRIHAPWESPDPPSDYPPPIVEHAAARERFLAVATKHLKRRAR